jgi:hypothetical protein
MSVTDHMKRAQARMLDSSVEPSGNTGKQENLAQKASDLVHDDRFVDFAKRKKQQNKEFVRCLQDFRFFPASEPKKLVKVQKNVFTKLSIYFLLNSKSNKF